MSLKDKTIEITLRDEKDDNSAPVKVQVPLNQIAYLEPTGPEFRSQNQIHTCIVLTANLPRYSMADTAKLVSVTAQESIREMLAKLREAGAREPVKVNNHDAVELDGPQSHTAYLMPESIRSIEMGYQAVGEVPHYNVGFKTADKPFSEELQPHIADVLDYSQVFLSRQTAYKLGDVLGINVRGGQTLAPETLPPVRQSARG